MATTIQINKRGSLTLPMEVRKKLGLEKGGVVMAEESDEGIVLKPAVAFPIEMYSDKRIAEFDREEEKLNQFLKRRGTK